MNFWLFLLIVIISYCVCEIVKYICYTVLIAKEMRIGNKTIKEVQQDVEDAKIDVFVKPKRGRKPKTENTPIDTKDSNDCKGQ